MTNTAARAIVAFATLERMLASNMRAAKAATARYAAGEASPELDDEYERLFWRGETLAARMLIVERYLPRVAPFAA